MLRTQNLQIRRGRKIVLTDITLEVKPGEVLGVLGPNGAGKSTLLGALCGELQADQGNVWLDERELSHWTGACLLYTSPSPRDRQKSRMPSSA